MDKKTQALVLTMEECGELTQACSKVILKNPAHLSVTSRDFKGADRALCDIVVTQ